MINKIGFIGQGWIGSSYADWYESNTNYEIVRYSKDKFVQNKDKIKECELVFVCVPTPSTPDGFDDSILEEVLALVGDGKIAVIKSTLLPGTTEKMQKIYLDKYILFSPEFLTEATVKFDVANPSRNIVGVTTNKHDELAKKVLEMMPKAKYEVIVPAKVAEVIKYGGNNWFYFKVIYMNLLYDWCKALDVDYNLVIQGMSHDYRIGNSHMEAVHNGGRGAGGHCFIKDFEAFRRDYEEKMPNDNASNDLLKDMGLKNMQLLVESNKNLDLLVGVYGKKIE